MLIGIHGKARHGKDTIGRYLDTRYEFDQWSFADPLWRGLEEMLGSPVYGFDNADKDAPLPAFRFSLRRAIQELGTGWGRNTMRQDLWILVLARRFEQHYGTAWNSALRHRRVVVTDVRFENEADWIRALGGTIWHVTRPDAPPAREHESESGIVAVEGEPLIENGGTPEELFRAVDGLVGVILRGAGTP